MKRKGQIIIGLALILIFILMALAAPVLAPNDPNATNLALKNAPPSAEYPLGCDQMGRCELSRLLYGARYSMGLTIPVLIVLAAFALFVGCYSSYKGGLVDEVIRILCDILMAFPLIVIAMALVSAVDNSVASVIIAIGISMLAWFLRMVRSYAKTECGKEYIEAARIAGASGLRIVLRHLIPNVFPQFVVYFTTGIATAIMSVSSFAFLGVGLIAGTPEWDKNYKGIVMSYILLSLSNIGSPLYVWVFSDYAISEASEEMSANYAEILSTLTSPWFMVLAIAATVVISIIVGVIAKKVYNKQFANAGIM